MPEKPQKPAFQRIEKYDLAYLADLVCDSDVERIGEALVDAEQAGAKAEREKILDFLGGRLDGMTSGEFVQIPNMRDWLKAELNKR